MHKKYWPLVIAFFFFIAGAIFKAKAASPTITILSPLAGQVITGNTFTAKFQIENFNLVNPDTYTKNIPGSGHIHLWLDQPSPNSNSAIKIFEPQYMFTHIKTGQHNLTVELVNNDGSSQTPPIIQTISFTSAQSKQLSTPSLLTTLKPIAIAIVSCLLLIYLIRTQTSIPVKTSKKVNKTKPSSKTKTKPKKSK